MKNLALAAILPFLSIAASAQSAVSGGDPAPVASPNGTAITPTSVTTALINGATIFLLQNGATANAFPNAPLLSAGNINSYFQTVTQNLSNGSSASSDGVWTNDLGGNASFYINIGINSSKFGIAGNPERSSDAYVTSSDSGFWIWAGINGAQYGGANEYLWFGSSVMSAGNIAGVLMTATASGPGAWVFNSSMTNTSGGGLLLSYGIIAGTGTFTAGMTAASGTFTNGVTASSGTFTATGNSQYSLTTSSGINVGGGTLNVAGGGGIKVTYGVVASTFVGGGAGITGIISAGLSSSANSSTTTIAANTQDTNTSIGKCIALSTTSITTTGGPLVLSATISAYNSGLNGLVALQFVVDGALVGNGTSGQDAVATDNMNLSFVDIFKPVSAAAHNVCLSAKTNAGTWTIVGGGTSIFELH